MPNTADGQTVNQDQQPVSFGGQFNPFGALPIAGGINSVGGGSPVNAPMDVPGLSVAAQNLPVQNPFLGGASGGIPAMRSPFAALDARGGFQPIQPFNNPKIGEIDYKFSPVSPVRQTGSPAPTIKESSNRQPLIDPNIDKYQRGR